MLPSEPAGKPQRALTQSSMLIVKSSGAGPLEKPAAVLFVVPPSSESPIEGWSAMLKWSIDKAAYKKH